MAAWVLSFALVYALRARRQRGHSRFAHLLFASAAAAALSAVFAAGPYPRAATALVARTQIPDFVRAADERIAEFQRLPATLWESLKQPFLDTLSEEPPTPALPPPILQEPGALEASVVPAVERLVALGLRVTTFLAAAGVMTAAFLLRSTTSQRAGLRKLRRRLRALEERLPP
jgi:hypothetical protein